MNVNYSDGVKELGDVYQLAQKATARLDELLGPEANTATVEWDRSPDYKEHILLTLRLRDPIGEVTTQLWSDHLRSVPETEVRLNLLLSGLFGIHVKKRLANLDLGGKQ
jgi:hypothetical protein